MEKPNNCTNCGMQPWNLDVLYCADGSALYQYKCCDVEGGHYWPSESEEKAINEWNKCHPSESE